ncbi:SDR family oxidoreductase [Streptomyces boncukensis]|uniref:SDR family oxidoreductase n=1 Tax=Streptomyces boncukensis TaxID=2711219 RepID=A0A6G4WX23_9ACTN|nr:SDR family oxidoreductase [Streptomyces boncukensis]NGO69836.1 SDR family oxidoreductase [Streptomyces boncukensis]
MGGRAVVAGGTRGVGLAVARKLCTRGTDVLLVYGDSDTDAKDATGMLAGLPGGATAVRANLAAPGGILTVLDDVRERWGALDVFVHAAARRSPAPALQATARQVRDDLAVAVAPLLAAAPALTELMSGRPGRIVAVSSSGAHRAVPGYLTQGLAKAALESLIRYLAVEFAPLGVSVNAVSTALLDKGADSGGPAEVRDTLAARTPAGRLTTPEDVANAVSLLCRPEADWIHGQVVTVDGGLSLVAG